MCMVMSFECLLYCCYLLRSPTRLYLASQISRWSNIAKCADLFSSRCKGDGSSYSSRPWLPSSLKLIAAHSLLIFASHCSSHLPVIFV